MPRMSGRLLLGFLLAWSAFAFLAELTQALEEYDRRQTLRTHPILWRFGMPQVKVLEQCLTEARQIIPRGSVVVFASPRDPAEAGFFRWRWAAYFLPELDVIRLEDPRAAEIAQYLIAHRLLIEHPRAEHLKRLTGCHLYRVKARV